MNTITSKEYSVFLKNGEFANFDYSIYSKIGILVDTNTKKYCLPIFLNKISALQKAYIIEISPGEENKDINSCLNIWKSLLNNQFDQRSLLINLGGGIIGDIGGFAASTYKRGIDFLQIPTSLVAMADACIGSKLGVNLINTKNQIGIFNNPKTVLINPEFLKTLPRNQLLSGFAEIIKHALIYDKNYWKELTNTPFENLIWEKIILRSLEIKNQIVSKDPFDTGERRKLNFGHTFGHAIESYYLQQKKPILHGEAIAMGIILETKLSNIDNYSIIKDFILKNFNIPETPPINDLEEWLVHDKKNKDEKINFSLLSKIGECSINNYKSLDELYD